MTDDYKVQPCPSAANPQAVTVTTRTGEVKRFRNTEHAENWINYTAGRRHRVVRR
ncbi:hypothetical protein [Corynebacterium sp.]|uniref:hypothetical protein n=1 Tax=Corynebacterium sp. TaxID=1720 RepID=UPI003B3BD0AD